MYRVFLIDDEVWALVSLEKLVPWEELGFTVCGRANSAKAAWEKISSDPPDVIITDIRMPGMSGLELLERLRGCGMDTEVILISGFAEFRYAQEAVHHGAFEYLLKQINREQLTDCLQRLNQHLSARKKRPVEEMPDTPDKQGASRIPAEYADSPSGSLSERLFRTKGWQLPGEGWIFVASCRDVGLQDPKTREAILWNDAGIFPVGTENGAAYFLCRTNRPAEQFEALTRKISSISASDREVFSTWGFSLPDGGRKNAGQLFREAEAALNSACFIGKTRLLYHGREDRWKGFDDLARSIRYGQNAGAREQLLSLQEAVRRGDVLTDELYSIMERADYEYRRTNSGRQFLPAAWSREEDLLLSFPEEEFFFSWLLSVFPAEKENRVTETILCRIEENLAEGLTLSAMAREMGMSQSSLSQLLKQSTGKTYSELVSEKRMAKVRELLVYTDQTMIEIARSTGFSDQFYLSKTFKKVHGVSPNEYRKSHRSL